MHAKGRSASKSARLQQGGLRPDWAFGPPRPLWVFADLHELSL